MERHIIVEHDIDIVQGELHGQAVYHSRCTCGWSSFWFSFRNNAREDGRAHLAKTTTAHVDVVEW